MSKKQQYIENRFYSWEQDRDSPFSIDKSEFELNNNEQVFKEVARLNLPFETTEVLLENFDQAYKSKHIADFTDFAKVKEIRRSKILVWLDKNL